MFKVVASPKKNVRTVDESAAHHPAIREHELGRHRHPYDTRSCYSTKAMIRRI
jgi:hypothetical protein